MTPLTQASAAAIARLRAYRCPPTIYSSLPLSRRAAVLLLLFADRHGNLRVLLTLRASNMSSYAGQVSLPGGKADSLSETPFDTARREAFEEIGLPSGNLPSPFRVEHLCELPAHLAVTEQGVRPCVAFLHTDGSLNSNDSNPSSNASSEAESAVNGEALIPILNATEVAAVFSSPFHRFISSKIEHSQTESPIKYRGQWNNWNGVKWRMHNFFIPKTHIGPTTRKDGTAIGYDSEKESQEADSYKVWGLTARILIDSARIAYGEDPESEFNQEIGEEVMLKRLWDRGRLKEERVRGKVMARKEVENERKDLTEESEADERDRKNNKL